jgi:hypothetical protein
MKLLNQITVMRPKTCEDCPFSAYVSDAGALCCGYLRESYMYTRDGTIRYRLVESPQDAYEHNKSCMFVERDEEE